MNERYLSKYLTNTATLRPRHIARFLAGVNQNDFRLTPLKGYGLQDDRKAGLGRT